MATEDRLHQPYRAQLVPGLERIIAAALDAGCYGACLSGAGPSILALHDKQQPQQGQRIAAAMARAGAAVGLEGRTLVLEVRTKGAEFRALQHDPSGAPLVI
jgi:homoserine kinase